jgi:hypothetical protein
MILDMIQGCRYLRRSTDRWFLSKNSTTRLKDSKVGTGPVCCEIVRSQLQTLRVHIYTLVLTRLLVGHDYNIYCLKFMCRRQCSSRTHHQFVPSLYSSHVITHSRMPPLPGVKQHFYRMMTYSRPQTSLPNHLRKISCRMVLSYQTRPTGQSLPCTNFWC